MFRYNTLWVTYNMQTKPYPKPPRSTAPKHFLQIDKTLELT